MKDSKYGIRGEGVLFNRQSGELIPEDEPVFLFRARDVHAVEALAHYHNTCEDEEHREAINRRIAEFIVWQQQNDNLMHEPTTTVVRPGKVSSDAEGVKERVEGHARLGAEGD